MSDKTSDKTKTPNNTNVKNGVSAKVSESGNTLNNAPSKQSSSFSKPISDSIDPKKVDANVEKEPSHYKKWLKKSLYILIGVLFMVIVVAVFFVDNNFFARSAAWLNPFKQGGSTVIQTSDSSSLDSQKIGQLQQQIQKLEDQLNQQLTSKSVQQLQKNDQLSAIIKLVNQHNQQQQQKITRLNKQVMQFTTLINRWKKRLADPDLLVDNIYNHLQLIQSQMILNYSPQVLAQQLEEVDRLVAELQIDELNTLRLELQSLIKKLDLKPSISIDAWLREIELVEQLIPLWLQQNHNIENDISLTDGDFESTSQPAENENNITTDKGFIDAIRKFISERLKQSLSFSKKQPSTVNYQPLITSQLDDAQINRYLKERFELLRLSILARNWDSLRQQSIEMDAWLTDHLPNAHKTFSRQLAMMSQYKPEYINHSLARTITILEHYRQSIHQSQSSSTISLEPQILNNADIIVSTQTVRHSTQSQTP